MILDHEHDFKQVSRLFEHCTKDGCSAGRYARSWIEWLTAPRKALPGDLGLPEHEP